MPTRNLYEYARFASIVTRIASKGPRWRFGLQCWIPHGHLALALCMFAAMAGCSSPAPLPEGTGAAEAAQEFYQAMLREDWASAYAALDPASRQHLSEQDFARQGRAQRTALGFEPKELHVRSCQEQNDGAIAHIVVVGEAPAGPRVYKDDVVLHRGASGWGVRLSSHFGRPQAKRRQ